MKRERIETLGQHGVAIDTETWAIRPGCSIPGMVCGSAGWMSGTPEAPKIEGVLLDKQPTLDLFREVAESEDGVMVGANLAYDLAVCAVEHAKRGHDVMPAIFQMLEDGRAYDLLLAENLNAIADGTVGKDPRTGGSLMKDGKQTKWYSLEVCVDLVLGRKDAKDNDEWRLRYGELDGVPHAEWPAVARDYPVDDAKNTIEVALAQAGVLPKTTPCHRWSEVLNNAASCSDCGVAQFGHQCVVRRPHRNLHDLSNQVWSAFALALSAAYGFAVDQSAVDVIERHALRNRADGITPYLQAGLIRPNGTANESALKRLVAIAYGSTEPCPICTGTGKVPSPSNPKSKINCFQMDADGITRLKTCDGTGLVLSADAPRSDSDQVGKGRDVLTESGDEFLMGYGEFLEDKKDLIDYVPYLRTARVPVNGHGAECPVRTSKPGTKKVRCSCSGPYDNVSLTLKPNPILETGRVSYSGYIQLFKRAPGEIVKLPDGTEEYVPSLRECIVARPGFVFSSEDYDSGEIVTHAQSCMWLVGESRMAEKLNAKVKVHNLLAASIINLSYEEFQKRQKEKKSKAARQLAKIGNFGFAGLMGPVKIVMQYRRQGGDTPCENGPTWILDDGEEVRGYKGTRFCILMDGASACGIKKVTEWRDHKIPPTCEHCIMCAAKLRAFWRQEWPENINYAKFVNDCVDNGMVITEEALARWVHLQEFFEPGHQLAPGEIMHHVSGRLRGGLNGPACANTFFQGLLADISKSAYRRVARECYDRSYRVPAQKHWNSRITSYGGAQSPLFGSRPIGFFHDEILSEHPESIGHDAATRVSEIMVEEEMVYCPDLAPACGAEPTLMRRWYKGAEKVVDEQGRLVVWEPK